MAERIDVLAVMQSDAVAAFYGRRDDEYRCIGPFDGRDRSAAAREAVAEVIAALRGIVEIGKRDLSNPKYDAFFESARAALARIGEQQ